ncbi:MAG: hypothetical protein ACD_33C00004G0001 [uncultured bacterium]|nr:MAG: hypothetical protein ACD_33C00004G0001 [uncultured bacterium]
MSFDEYINRPKYEIENLMRIIDEIDNKKMKMNKNLLNDLESTGSKNKLEIE